MRRIATLTIACLLSLVAGAPLPAQALVVETDPLTPAEQLTKFHLPPGFEIQLVASNPDIGQPMNMNFDAQGRLWVTSSVEYPYPVGGEGVEAREERWGKPEERPARDWVVVIDGIDDTGKPASITRFAEGLNIPIGIIPDGDGAIIYSIPNIERFRDTDGDGKADQREKLYGPFGNLDTHGMVNSFTRGLDGWIYACHGFRNTSKVQGTDGHVVEMNSGNTFRFKPDGSRVEHWTHGQVNPFGLCFDPWGNLYSADCHSMPLTCLIRGAYYQSFGKPHDGLGFGPDMIDHNHGSTGICGCAWYEAPQYPADYNGCIFLCNPVTGRVHRDKIEWRGSSPWVNTQEDFITCDDGWFRPVDVKLGPDGALYIADFYNAIIGHYEVPLEHPKRDRSQGRIWRIVYRGVESSELRVASPEPKPALGQGGSSPAEFDLTELSLDELIEQLGSPNVVTRGIAVATIRAKHTAAQAAMAAKRRYQNRQLPQLSDAGRAMLIRLAGELLMGDLNGAEVLDDESPFVIAAAVETLLSLDSSAVVKLAHRGDATESGQVSALRDPHVLRIIYEEIAAQPGSLATSARMIDGQAFLSRTFARFDANSQDTHLRHQILLTLRALMSVPDNLDSIRASATEHSEIWSVVALGSDSPAASALLLELLPKLADSKRSAAIQRISRFGDADQLTTLVSQLSESDANWQSQLASLRSIQQGLNQRGGEHRDLLQGWATRIVGELLQQPLSQQLGWTPVAYGPNARPESAFGTQTRPFADGVQGAMLHSSFPPGETGTGILRSDSFELPSRLSFFVAGHNGFPNKPATPHNLVRLVDADSRAILREAQPPRNDTAQRVEWDLTEFAGRRGSVEIVDGDPGTAYAWLAAGRFSVDGLNPSGESPQLEACQLVAELKLDELSPQLTTIVRDTNAAGSLRSTAAGAILSLHPDARLAMLSEAAAGAVLAESCANNVC
ncbi:MAG: hypothetical protein R3B90_18605 [Planctomycetaceae bacterium]